MTLTPQCTLCRSSDTAFLLHDENLFTYYRCNKCKLHFAGPGQRLSPAIEKSRYDHHENNPDDPDYRNFLNQIFLPLSKLIPEKSSGLDFGSGPGPTLNRMFERAGHRVAIYDPFYAPREQLLTTCYDFITTTETAEHFFHPRREFELLWKILKPNGYLGIMTLMLHSTDDFENWFYRMDDTHVTFYKKDTFIWLAGHLNAQISFYGDRVCILKKPSHEKSHENKNCKGNHCRSDKTPDL